MKKELNNFNVIIPAEFNNAGEENYIDTFSEDDNRVLIQKWFDDLSVHSPQSTIIINDDLSIDIIGDIILNGSASIVSDFYKPPFVSRIRKQTGNFTITGVEGIKSLETLICPEEIDGNFSVTYCANLTSLKGVPQKISGSFSCINNRKLKSLKYGPREVGKHYYCKENALTDLYFVPALINGDFDCSDNKITSLINGPSEVRGMFRCSDNLLTSLKYCPDYVGSFDFHNNMVEVLEEDCFPKIDGSVNMNNNMISRIDESLHGKVNTGPIYAMDNIMDRSIIVATISSKYNK